MTSQTSSSPVLTEALAAASDSSRHLDAFYGFVVETTYGYAAHAGRSRSTGTKVHRVRIETVVAVDPTAATSPAVLDGRVRFAVGRVLQTLPVCGSAKHATVHASLTAADVTCRWCRPAAERVLAAEAAR